MLRYVSLFIISLLLIVAAGCEDSQNQLANEVVSPLSVDIVTEAPSITPTVSNSPTPIPVPEPTKKPYLTTIFDAETAEKFYGELGSSFTSEGGSSGIGTGKILYQKNGESGYVLVEDIDQVKTEDVDKDGIIEVIISRTVPINGVPNTSFPNWDDVYNFDFVTKKLVFNSTQHPEFYKLFLLEHNIKDSDPIRSAINLRIANLARLIIEKEFIPDESLKNVKAFMNGN